MALNTVSAQIRTTAATGSLSETTESSPGMQGLVAATSGGGGGKPTLYFYTTKPRKGDNAAERCQMIEEQILFSAEPKNVKPRDSSSFDFRAAIAAKHFNVVRVDVTDITTGPITAAKPPLIVITDSKGEVKHQLTGSSISAAKLYASMASVMKDEGKDISKPVTKAAGILSRLYAIECSLNRAKARSGRTAETQAEALTAAKSQGMQAFEEALSDMNL